MNKFQIVSLSFLCSLLISGISGCGGGGSSSTGGGGAVLINSDSGTPRSAEGTWVGCPGSNDRYEITFSGQIIYLNHFLGTTTNSSPCPGGTFDPTNSIENISISTTTNQIMSGGWVNLNSNSLVPAPLKAGSGSLGASPTATRLGSSAKSFFFDDSTVGYRLYASTMAPVIACAPGISGNEICLSDLPFVKGTRTTTPPAPTLTSFTPGSGSAGDSIVINGSNFSTTAANNVVLFNGTPATVSSATTTSLTVTIPGVASSGKITVVTDGGSVMSTNNFTVTYVAPTITGFTPTSGSPGTVVTITGSHLDATSNSVNALTAKINGVNASVISAIATSMTIYVPVGTNGPISVTTAGGTGSSTATFTVSASPTAFAYSLGDGIPELTSAPVLPASWTASASPFNVTVPVDNDTASVYVLWGSNTTGEGAVGNVELTPGSAQTASVSITPTNGVNTAHGSDYTVMVYLCSVSGECASSTTIGAATGAISAYLEQSVAGAYAKGSSPTGLPIVTYTETGVLLPMMTVQ